MAMKTQFQRSGDTLVVSIKGKIDFASQETLKEDLYKLLKPPKTDEVPKNIIFDMGKLEFVGSSGITSFIQTLKDFNTKAPNKPCYQNVKSEFQKIIRAYDEENAFEISDPQLPTKKPMDQ